MSNLENVGPQPALNKATVITVDAEHQPIADSKATALTAGAPHSKRRSMADANASCRSVDVERQSNPPPKAIGATAGAHPSKRRSTVASKANVVMADVERQSRTAPKAKDRTAGAHPSKRRSYSGSNAMRRTVDVEHPSNKRSKSTRMAAGASSLTKRRSRSSAKTSLRPADVECQSKYSPKAIGATAGAHPSKRRSTVASKANVVMADVERQPSMTSKTIRLAAGAPLISQSTVSPKTKDGTAETGGEGDRRFADPLVIQIKELWRRRQSWHRAEKSLTLAGSAICRGYVGVNGKADKAGLKKASELFKRIESGEEQGAVAIAVTPLLAARAQIRGPRELVEKGLEKLAKKLPVADVVKETPGLGFLSLASLVGEAGDFSAYRSLRGLWKRMGVAVIEGERQRCKTDAIAAKEHGYSPSRRSVTWNVGSSLIGGMGRGPRPHVGEDVSTRDDLSRWQKLFVERLRFEADKDPDHRRPDRLRDDGEVFESYSKHAANRARRIVEKQFLKHLYQKWRNNVGPQIALKSI